MDTLDEAVDVITREGLTFTATGADWAANPDGSVIVDYASWRAGRDHRAHRLVQRGAHAA